MNTKERQIWAEGFEAGVRETLRIKAIAIKIGDAIIDALDERYELNED